MGSSAQAAEANDALPALVQVLEQTDDLQFQLDVLKGMSEALKGRRDVPMPAGWDALASKLSHSPDPGVRELVQSLSVTFGSRGALDDLRRQLMNHQASLATRRKALEGLVAAKDAPLVPLLYQLLGEPDLRAAALRALAVYDNTRTPAEILRVYPDLQAGEKADALHTLVSRAPYARTLLDALARGRVARKDLTADIVRQLRSLKDPGINAEVEKLWGQVRESPEEKQEEIAQYKKMLETKTGVAPSPARGRALFARTCQQCHTLYGVGGKVGPDLTGSNRGDLDYLLQNVLDPNAIIPNDYRTSTLETKDERVLTGIVTREDNSVVTLVTANETVTVPRPEIESLIQGTFSMMPEGLLAAFNANEVRDLVSYLRTKNQVPMQAAEDNLGGFFNGQDLTGWTGNTNLWKVENGEIVGTSPGLQQNEFLAGPLLLGDFRLVCRVKLVPNEGNSGIQFRSATLPDGEMKGYQADMGAGWWGKLYEERGRGLLWDHSGEAQLKPGEWNLYEIVAVGHRIRTALNGHPCARLEDPAGATEGVVAFQLHAGGPMEVRFKDFKLELNPAPELATGRE